MWVVDPWRISSPPEEEVSLTPDPTRGTDASPGAHRTNSESSHTVTDLLHRIQDGDEGAREELATRIYDELHRLAKQRIRRAGQGHSLSVTELVHEAWMRISRVGSIPLNGRDHFLRTASRVMRYIIVDHIRAKKRHKRNSNGERLPLDILVADYRLSQDDILALNDALTKLRRLEPGLERLVELRFFGRQSMPDVARQLGLSLRTVERDWQVAKAWLRKELG